MHPLFNIEQGDCSIHLFSALNHPRPITSLRAQAGHDRVLANVIHLRGELFAAFILAAHRLVAREGNNRMQMIRHQEEQCDVPALSGFIRTRRIEQSLCERWVSQLPLLFVAIKRDADVKQCTRFNPVRNGMMEL